VPRQSRLDIPGLVYHVMARGIEGQSIFRDEDDRERFLTRLSGEVSKPGGPQLYAWALMSNHFHLLLRGGEGRISPMMRRLMTGHAVTYNIRHKRQGHLFQNRFKSIVVEEEPYFLELVRYIHLNPVRAGIVKSVEELATYRYTGHAVISGTRDCAEQDVASVIMRFSDRQKAAVAAYNRFVADGFGQGRREELRGGGLVRSAGGVAAIMARDSEDRDLSDERILGGGDFVESVLRDSEKNSDRENLSIDEILNDVAKKSGVSRELILGASRNRTVSSARKLFYVTAHERAGATLTLLGRLTGRSHVAVKLAIEQLKAEKAGKLVGE